MAKSYFYPKTITTIEMCDECATELMNKPYIRLQVWGEPFDTFERIFCSPECVRKYIKDWDCELFEEVSKGIINESQNKR